jgi:hypothetical protein
VSRRAALGVMGGKTHSEYLIFGVALDSGLAVGGAATLP